MKQPKKVQRRVEEEIEVEDFFIDIIIDMKALKADEKISEVKNEEIVPKINENEAPKQEVEMIDDQAETDKEILENGYIDKEDKEMTIVDEEELDYIEPQENPNIEVREEKIIKVVK